MSLPPPLKNDCFALPPGHHWTPVDEALEALRTALTPIVGTETLPIFRALGRVLAADVTAQRANPPYANSAVDGYAVRAADWPGAGPFTVPLVPGRSAAGAPFLGDIPPGHAVRILTGAMVPAGVDTVLLQEDTSANATEIAFHGPLKPGANIRKAGEDLTKGASALPKGARLRPQDLALLAAIGVSQVTVHTPLRIGVLSTGDEVVNASDPAQPHQIYDANRPMLLAQIAAWGFQPVDLGLVPDNRAALAARLNQGAQQADMILTSGGASAGDEDHVSALLDQTGSLNLWRIAMKPGRPLALGLWEGTPIFGLPGNPVAAFVCAHIFAKPAARALSGEGWQLDQGFTVPAAFTKKMKAGRREYLRARLNADGGAEVFASEGSGRISGLSWATGLVDLPEGERLVQPGDPVRFLPF